MERKRTLRRYFIVNNEFICDKLIHENISRKRELLSNTGSLSLMLSGVKTHVICTSSDLITHLVGCRNDRHALQLAL